MLCSRSEEGRAGLRKLEAWVSVAVRTLAGSDSLGGSLPISDTRFIRGTKRELPLSLCLAQPLSICFRMDCKNGTPQT